MTLEVRSTSFSYTSPSFLIYIPTYVPYTPFIQESRSKETRKVFPSSPSSVYKTQTRIALPSACFMCKSFAKPSCLGLYTPFTPGTPLPTILPPVDVFKLAPFVLIERFTTSLFTIHYYGKYKERVPVLHPFRWVTHLIARANWY